MAECFWTAVLEKTLSPGKIPWRRKWQPIPILLRVPWTARNSVLLPGKCHGWKSLVVYCPCGPKESAMTEWLLFLSLQKVSVYISLYILGEVCFSVYLRVCLKNYGQRSVILYRGGKQNHPKEKEKQEGKVVIWGGFTNSRRTKRSEKQRREGKVHLIKCRVPKNS